LISCTRVQNDDEEDLPLMAIRLSRMEPNNHNETQEEEEQQQQHAPLAFGCFSSALVPTVEPPNPEWGDNIFPECMKRLLAIRPDENQTIGDARMDPLFFPKNKNRRRHWHFLACKPHTGGCLHGKVLLFRSDKGLRVVISGNNSYQSQMENE
jgi:hypothetical protein